MVKEAKMQQTEIGLISEDWEIVRIENIAEVDCENLSSSTNPDLEIKYISLECINEGSLMKFDELNFKNAPSRARRILRKGDILISTVRPNLKSHYFFNSNAKDFIASTGFSVIRTSQSSNYIYHHFFGKQINRQIENLIVGSNYPAINNKDVKNLQIPLPPLAEQEAIAKALSDCNSWIDSIEQVLAKKRLIKQGAMQQLLTPKEDWEVKKLGEIVTIKSGESPSRFFMVDSGLSYLKVDELNNSPKYTVGNAYFIKSDNYVPKGSIIFPKRGASIFLNKIRILGSNSFMDTNLMTLTISSTDNNEFLYYSLIYFGLDKIADTTSIPQINNKHILPLEIPFPSLSEQTRIATILSDMDLEIEALAQKLHKARQIKQGMMQELLTGNVRLV